MRVRLRELGVDAVVLDIEGTTTPIAFVYDVLFRFARAHLREYLVERPTDALPALALLREEWSRDVAQRVGPPDWSWPETEGAAAALQSTAGAAAYIEWLMDRDRKSAGLKDLQGLIWARGYRQGVLKGEVFPDVPAALARWRAASVDVAIYSSGSELAQRLLFAHTPQGDLTSRFCRFFDIRVGSKLSAESYRRIAHELGRPTSRILFISDVTTELDAANEAGCQVLLCMRPGNRPQGVHTFPVVTTFEEITSNGEGG